MNRTMYSVNYSNDLCIRDTTGCAPLLSVACSVLSWSWSPGVVCHATGPDISCVSTVFLTMWPGHQGDTGINSESKKTILRVKKVILTQNWDMYLWEPSTRHMLSTHQNIQQWIIRWARLFYYFVLWYCILAMHKSPVWTCWVTTCLNTQPMRIF